MKKFFSLFFIIALLPVLLIHCTAKDEGIVLNYWDTMPEMEKTGKILHDLIRKYDDDHPEIKINLQYIQWENFNDKLQTSIVGGNPPDIVLLDRFVTASYADKKALVPLDEFIKKENIKSSDYFKNCWDECVYNDKIWSLPHHTDVRVLYYKVEDFQEAGLDPNKPPKTWDEIFEYAKKLTKKDEKGRLLRIGFLPTFSQGRWLHLWGWANGGRFMKGNKITCNDPKIVEALEWIVKFNDWYGRKAVIAANQGYGSREMDPFIMGKLSMIIEGDWYIGILEKFGPNVKFKVAAPPAPKGKKQVTWSGGFALAIPRGSKYVEKSWDLIKYLTDYEAQVTYATQAYRIPALKKAAQTEFFLTHPHYKTFIKMMKFSKYRPVTPIANYYWDQLSKAVEFAILKEKKPRQALDDASKNTQIFLNEYMEKSIK